MAKLFTLPRSNDVEMSPSLAPALCVSLQSKNQTRLQGSKSETLPTSGQQLKWIQGDEESRQIAWIMRQITVAPWVYLRLQLRKELTNKQLAIHDNLRLTSTSFHNTICVYSVSAIHGGDRLRRLQKDGRGEFSYGTFGGLVDLLP